MTRLEAELAGLVDDLNTRAGVDAVRHPGDRGWVVGGYYITGAYGGYKLEQIVSDAGGVRDV